MNHRVSPRSVGFTRPTTESMVDDRCSTTLNPRMWTTHRSRPASCDEDRAHPPASCTGSLHAPVSHRALHRRSIRLPPSPALVLPAPSRGHTTRRRSAPSCAFDPLHRARANTAVYHAASRQDGYASPTAATAPQSAVPPASHLPPLPPRSSTPLAAAPPSPLSAPATRQPHAARRLATCCHRRPATITTGRELTGQEQPTLPPLKPAMPPPA